MEMGKTGPWGTPEPESRGAPGTCKLCGKPSGTLSGFLGICPACLRGPRAREAALAAHARARRPFRLPPSPPRTPGGVRCPLCANACSLGEGEVGFCGLRTARRGRLVHLAGTPRGGLLAWYRDPLPTNCVADWVCAGHAKRGMHNLAVFYASCTFDCLFCQNWEYRRASPGGSRLVSARELASLAREDTFCACFFGGDPASQTPHALAAGRLLASRGVAVCFETNGSENPRLLRQAVLLSLRSGGCIKFDLKAYDEDLHIALTGVSNTRTLENFALAVSYAPRGREPPLVVASTLLVPGYVEAEEVYRLARFIASLDPTTPYSLLAFAPCFLMSDLPRTSRRHAAEALEAARTAGLTRIHLGNLHLLGPDYPLPRHPPPKGPRRGTPRPE